MERSLVELQCPFTLIVNGATSSGKTWWVKRLLKNANEMLSKPVDKILYFYSIYQNIYSDMEKEIENIQFCEGLPSATDNLFSGDTHNLIVLDDMMDVVLKSPEMEKLFTQTSHHRNISVIFITQNIFAQSKCSRTIALNTHYLVLFKSLRDLNQIMKLSSQIYPGKGSFLLESYKDATCSQKFGYLLIDLHPQSSGEYSVRTSIFPHELPIVYKPKH